MGELRQWDSYTFRVEQNSQIAVLGSANVDTVFQVERIPGPGETLLATSSQTHLGGKGQNQAVAAARFGVGTCFIGCVGDDQHGTMVRHNLADAGVGVERLRVSGSDTGVAIISVDRHGENAILVSAGANADVDDLSHADVEAISGAAVLLMQLEIPLTTVTVAAKVAADAGVTVVLNAAPALSLPAKLLDVVDVLIVNQHEALVVSGKSKLQEACRLLSELVSVVIVTLGAEGSEVHRRGEDVLRVPTRSVAAVDTTGAGDTFCGVFVAALTEHTPLPRAVELANAAASLAVTRPGASSSIPDRAAVLAEIGG